MEKSRTGVNHSILEVQMLGDFSLKIGDKALSGDKVRGKQIWNLLEYIMVNRHKEISADGLIQALWSDDDTDDPSNALKNLAYRLRGTLKQSLDLKEGDYIVYKHGAYVWNQDLPCRIDVDELEEAYKTAQQKTLPRDEILNCYKKVIDLYKNNEIPKLVGSLGLEIKNHLQRRALKAGLDALIEARQGTIADTIDVCEQYDKIFVKGDRYTERASRAPLLLDRLKSVSYSEIISLYESLSKDDGEYGTQHSSKGNAYENVVAVMDNGDWWKGSNYENIFTLDDSKRSDLKTRKLVYTAGSRAIKNLIIFFYVDNSAPSKHQKALAVIEDAKTFFGEDNVSEYPYIV